MEEPQVGRDMAVLQAGAKVPDFALKLATPEVTSDFKLSEHLGKGPMVFGFFPLAFTGVCTTEMCDLRDNFAALGALNAKVYGFSVDAAPSNRAFATQHGLPFGILCDPNREVIGRFWPANPSPVHGTKETAKRGAMIVNTDGTVKWVSISDDVTQWVGVDEIKKHL